MIARYAVQVLDAKGIQDSDNDGNNRSDKDMGSSAQAGASQETETGSSKSSDNSSGGGEGKPSQKAWGAEFLSKRFYKGGFEEKMNKREAALVLGVLNK